MNASAAKSTIFNECGRNVTGITSKEHRLLIIFVSNNDSFTSKGFKVVLQGKFVSITSFIKPIQNQNVLQ